MGSVAAVSVAARGGTGRRRRTRVRSSLRGTQASVASVGKVAPSAARVIAIVSAASALKPRAALATAHLRGGSSCSLPARRRARIASAGRGDAAAPRREIRAGRQITRFDGSAVTSCCVRLKSTARCGGGVARRGAAAGTDVRAPTVENRSAASRRRHGSSARASSEGESRPRRGVPRGYSEGGSQRHVVAQALMVEKVDSAAAVSADVGGGGDAPPPPPARSPFAVPTALFYASVSVGIISANKLTLTTHGFPSSGALALAQFAVTCFCLGGLKLARRGDRAAPVGPGFASAFKTTSIANAARVIQKRASSLRRRCIDLAALDWRSLRVVGPLTALFLCDVLMGRDPCEDQPLVLDARDEAAAAIRIVRGRGGVAAATWIVRGRGGVAAATRIVRGRVVAATRIVPGRVATATRIVPGRVAAATRIVRGRSGVVAATQMVRGCGPGPQRHHEGAGLDRISTSRPRRRRESSPRNIHVAAAAVPRPALGSSAERATASPRPARSTPRRARDGGFRAQASSRRET